MEVRGEAAGTVVVEGVVAAIAVGSQAAGKETCPPGEGSALAAGAFRGDGDGVIDGERGEEGRETSRRRGRLPGEGEGGGKGRGRGERRQRIHAAVPAIADRIAVGEGAIKGLADDAHGDNASSIDGEHGARGAGGEALDPGADVVGRKVVGDDEAGALHEEIQGAPPGRRAFEVMHKRRTPGLNGGGQVGLPFQDEVVDTIAGVGIPGREAVVDDQGFLQPVGREQGPLQGVVLGGPERRGHPVEHVVACRAVGFLVEASCALGEGVLGQREGVNHGSGLREGKGGGPPPGPPGCA
jgi:hypothetical protein